jgi:hypothetical protein
MQFQCVASRCRNGMEEVIGSIPIRSTNQTKQLSGPGLGLWIFVPLACRSGPWQHRRAKDPQSNANGVLRASLCKHAASFFSQIQHLRLSALRELHPTRPRARFTLVTPREQSAKTSRLVFTDLSMFTWMINGL